MTIRKLSRMPYAQAHVVVDDENGTISLVSYVTTVAVINHDVLTVNGLYSMTTRKHIGAFMHEYASPWSFQTAKTLAETGDSMNILTGEVYTR